MASFKRYNKETKQWEVVGSKAVVDKSLTNANVPADAKATGDKLKETILYTPQELTPEQQEQAQKNIGANATVKQIDSKTVKLSVNILTSNAKLGVGWTGDNASGYTHTSGVEPLIFEVPTEPGAVYVCRFTTSYIADEFGTISIGEGPGALCYNGRNDLIVPLAADGGNFKVTPFDSVKFTLSNIKLQKVSDTGEALALALTAILSPGHDDLLGFRNIVIGNSLFKSPNATRTVCIGDRAMDEMEVGHRTICIGGSAMQHFKYGENNIAIGADSMFQFDHGSDNIAMGVSALGSGSGDDNIAIGRTALNNPSIAKARNIAIGKNAANGVDGTGNVVIGYNAASGMREDARANVMIGDNCLGGRGTRMCVAIGRGAQTMNGIEAAIAIGAGAIAKKTGQVVIGGQNSNELVIFGKKKIVFNPDGSVTWESI